MADLVTLQGWLAQAETARHQLLIGRRAASASVEGKSTTFMQADISKLDAYITSLRNQIAALSGVMRPTGPIQFTF